MNQAILQDSREELTVKASGECLSLRWTFLVLGMILLPVFLSLPSCPAAAGICAGGAPLLIGLYLCRALPHVRLELSGRECRYTDFLGRKHEFRMEDVRSLKKIIYRGNVFWSLKDADGKEIVRFNAKMLENMDRAVTFIRVHMNKNTESL